MDLFTDIFSWLSPVFKNLWVQITLLIVFATVHGYFGAWLAVRMLFRPRHPVKIFGLTVFPQGMIPRHRDRLANAIGKAVGEELVSTETIMEELLGKEFLRKKLGNVVESYTRELMTRDYPSLLDAMPDKLRPAVTQFIDTLTQKLTAHIEQVLRSEDSLETIRAFVTRRVDDFLSKRVSEIVDDKEFANVVQFLDGRIKSAVMSPSLELKVREFISRRVDELANTETPLGDMFTIDAISLLKEKAAEQIAPMSRHLTEIAAAERTRNQIGALIKKEVHEFYENLPFFKKIFVSRDNLLYEVDDLVNESLPRRIEETLKGDFFAEEARNFINRSIDETLARPIPDLIGKVAPEQLDRFKSQIVTSIISAIRGDQMLSSISDYLSSMLGKLRPHSIDAIMQTVQPESEEKLKNMLSKGLVQIIAQPETSAVINSVIAKQIQTLLSRPIGNLAETVSEDQLKNIGETITNTILEAIKEKLPDAIKEFDVGGVVREKINNYPVEKLESLIMSVAREHLRTIELFGALFGFVIGVVQAILSYWAFAH